jgi:hypothetical protein
MELTKKEKQAIKTLNYVAAFDGIISDENEMEMLLNYGIKKFVSLEKQRYVKVNTNVYPMRIQVRRKDLA